MKENDIKRRIGERERAAYRTGFISVRLIYHFFSESFYKFFFFFYIKGHTSVEVDFSIRVCACDDF